MYSFPNFEPVWCSTSGSNCCFLIRRQVSQEAGMVVWSFFFFFNPFKTFPQFVVIHTVKGFMVVNEADIFLELPCYLHNPTNVGNLVSGSSASLKHCLYIWKVLIHLLLKLSLKDFKHNLTIMCNEHNCTVVWTSLALPFFWDWNENLSLLVLWSLLHFPNLLAYGM